MRGAGPPSPTAVEPAAPTPSAAVVVPPLNFAMVAPGVYRSGYPNAHNVPFLRQLKLKVIIHLGAGPEQQQQRLFHQRFAEDESIHVVHVPFPGNVEPFVCAPASSIREALGVMLDARNHPLLLHCNKGKYRTGCVVGCYRRLQGWPLTSTFEEYRRYASQGGGGPRLLDQQYIELFDISRVPRGGAPPSPPRSLPLLPPQDDLASTGAPSAAA
jgi:tyrosine-protein phosphatase SIW14|eukprot:SAG25_NODE_1583_length_2729_cov_10.015205_2_plen_214_part_00